MMNTGYAQASHGENCNHYLTPADVEALCAQTFKLIKRCGGFERASYETRVSTQQLHRYTVPDSGQIMPVDIMINLCRMCKNNDILLWLLARVEITRGNDDLVRKAIVEAEQSISFLKAQLGGGE